MGFLFFLNCRCELSSGLNGLTWPCISNCCHFTLRQCSLATLDFPVNFQTWPPSWKQLNWSWLIRVARVFGTKQMSPISWHGSGLRVTVRQRLARQGSLDVSQTVAQISPQGWCLEFLTAELGLQITAGNEVYFDQDYCEIHRVHWLGAISQIQTGQNSVTLSSKSSN